MPDHAAFQYAATKTENVLLDWMPYLFLAGIVALLGITLGELILLVTDLLFKREAKWRKVVAFGLAVGASLVGLSSSIAC